ncbi:hypothetical protein [Sphingomonas sp. BK580]
MIWSTFARVRNPSRPIWTVFFKAVSVRWNARRRSWLITKLGHYG